ncbi:beta-lactamase family protein [Leucobacter sp. cx-42]|uniref:serine hydrolase domain-containing protein n=1 Tax=unclassified Leucobacter TaxID=2621730 RepID=UPI00165EA38F|nr:beta-lactamase family protein [Leucobacter sp. cx-42]
MFASFARRTRVATVGALAVVALSLTACSGAGQAGNDSNSSTVSEGLAGSFESAVQNALEKSGSTQAVVGVWTSEGEYVQGFGEGIDAGAQFNAAQTATPFACAILLEKVAAGELKLDQPVSDVLTRQAHLDDITFEQLCTQRSGLADYKKGFERANLQTPERNFAEQELLANTFARSPLSWPGLDFHESDANALILHRALRIQAAVSPQNLYQDNLFEATGMRSSYIPESTETSLGEDNLSPLAYPTKDGKAVCDAEDISLSGVSTTMISGPGSAVTTVTDMKRFYDAYFTGTFGGPKQASLTTTTESAANPERDKDGNPTGEVDEDGPQWGFGVEKVGPLLGHAGKLSGTISAAYQDPETKFTVAVALNNSTAGASFARALAFELAAIAAENGAAPEMGWTAEAQANAIAEKAVCAS